METLLTLTLSGSALTLLLLALRYLLLRRMPSTVYYYAWLLVLLRFMLPLPGLIPTERPAAANDTPVITAQSLSHIDTPTMQFITAPAESIRPASDAVAVPEPREELPAQIGRQNKNAISLKSPALWTVVWGIGTAVSLCMIVVSYKVFSRRVRRSLIPATAEDRRVYRTLPGRKPRLCRCAAFRTPLMFGVFRPLITLPEVAYDKETLKNVLRHELLHYRRRDTLYKWFAVAVLSTQWFNPLSYLIRRELNRACELSCDEMLLRDMDRADKLSYGHTLLNMAAAGVLPSSVAATTFSTEKRNLKERLEQIMHYKKSGTRVLAAVLALTLLIGVAVLAGPLPGAAADDQPEHVVKVSTVDGLLAAIAPDTVIELEAGTYDLTTALDYGQDTHSAYYSWNRAYDGFELVLQNMRNLTIRGAGKDETVLAAVPRYANVLQFYGCQGINVEALTAGHTTEPGFCMGGVLSFDNCERVTVDACGLYGCGTIGVQARECTELTVKSTEIYKCSYGAVSVGSCRDVTVEDCDIHDHGTRAGQGDAIFVFDLNYSDGVTIHQNRIHDNRAQVMLNSDYARRVLFLSNELRGNAFVTNVFDLVGYGITVDGCVFEGNDVRGGWYRGSGVYASSVSGETLEAALFGEMTLRDIDPDDVLPPVPPSGALDLPKGGEVMVTSVDEFLEALGPDRTIILDGPFFDLSTASNYGGIGTDCYYWAEDYDGPELVIHDVNGLTIYAKDSSSGATTLAAIPRYADVLSFRNCENLTLSGFTAGHTKEPGSCSGGVLNLQNCSQVTLEKMRLYGCGVLGIQAFQCATLNILRTEIYECSQGGASFFQCDGIRFADCGIHDVPSPALRFNESGDKTWNGEAIVGLDGEYDVDENGALTACSYMRENAQEYVRAVDDSVNPYGNTPTHIYKAGWPQASFAHAVQKDIAEGNWESLADKLHFPLVCLRNGTSFRVLSREEFLGSLEGNYVLAECFSESWRRNIANADLSEYGRSIYGETFCDHMLAFSSFGDALSDEVQITEDNLRVTAISFDDPLWPGRGEQEFLSDVPYNPYDSFAPTPFEEGSPQLEFAKSVQHDFAARDWNALADKMSYPVQIFNGLENFTIDSRDAFLSERLPAILTPDFCELVANAELSSYGDSPFGNTFAAHRLAMACQGDQLRSAEDLKITCISVVAPLYQYKYNGSVPPTPMPSLRVMFYETELGNEFTIYPPDAVELHVQLPPEIGPGAEVEWTSDRPSVLAVEKTGADTALVSCVDDGSLPQTCKLTVRCGDMAREITVYCRK